MSDDGKHIPELIGEVRKLEATNSATARVVRALQADVAALDVRFAENTEQLRKRTRNTLVLVACVALLLAGLTGAGIYAANYFACRNDVNARWFAAERDKVSGQIRGVDEIGRDPRAGVTQFKQASQNYLDTIGRIPATC